MNPQMQNYRQYAQAAQTRSPAATRRPGELDPLSTYTLQTYEYAGLPSYSVQMTREAHHIMDQVSLPLSDTRSPYHPASTLLAKWQQQPQASRRDNRADTLRRDIYLPFSTSGMDPRSANAQAQAQQRQIYEQQMAQRNAALEHQLAQRRARKPTDRNMPEGVEDIIVGDGVQQYKDLREVEKKLDFAMMRKRLDIQDSFSRNVKRQKTMRIWISNTAENQPWQRGPMDENSFDFNSGADSTYRVRIEGKVLDEPEEDVSTSDIEDDETEKPEKENKSEKKFTHYFKSLSVEFDKAKGMANIDPSMQIEWKKQPNSSDLDCLEFQRKGDENLNITINLVRDEKSERFRLSQALSSALDMEEADRAEVVMGIWEYVKAMGLQEDEERRTIRCDERLRQIFGTDSFIFPQVADRIMPHLHPLTPVRLHYTIRVDEAFISSPEPTIYDIKLTVDDPLRAKAVAFTQNPNTTANLRQIAALDDQLAVLIQAIQHHKAKHTFYKNFSKDPVAFVRKWYASQQHDLSVLLGEVERGDVAGLEFAKGGKEGVWGSEVVSEAVRYRLAKAETAR